MPGLPEMLRRCTAAFGCQAAVALRLPVPEEPAIIAAYPSAAIDPALLGQLSGLLVTHAGVASAGGCVQGRVAWPGLGSGRNHGGALIAVARLPGGSAPCALILVGRRFQWGADAQATARALATVIAARIRRAEDAREIAERRAVTDALINAAPDAVVIADGARRIVAFNHAAEELHGRRSAEALGQRLDELLIPQRNRAAFLEATAEFLRTQDPGEFAARMRLPVLRGDGTERTVELTRLPLVVGGQTYFCSFARDVTELERANAALAASEARVRLLSELAPVGIARTDGTGTCAYVNERWCALNGQPAEDILGTSWLEAVDPETSRGSGGSGRAPGWPVRSCAPTCSCAVTTAEPLWVHAAVTSLPDQADLPRGFMVALTNVTARKRAEQERDRLLASERAAVHDLTDQTERLNSLIAAAIPGVLVLDEHNMIVQVNQSMCDLLGIGEPPAKLTGLSGEHLREPVARTFSQARGRPSADGPVQRGPAASRRAPVRLPGRARAGVRLLAGLRRGRVPGRPAAALGHVRPGGQEQERDRRLEAELTSRRAAEDARQELAEQNDELRELDELKTRFLATVSHELRSPLTSIVSYAELIRDEDQLSPTTARFLDVISRNAERITKLVGDLLLLSRIEAGMIPLELTQVSVAEVVTEALQAATPGAVQQDVTLDGSAPHGPPVLADRVRLVQVIDNLIANAVKFTDEGGQVRVTAAAAAGSGGSTSRTPGSAFRPTRSATCSIAFSVPLTPPRRAAPARAWACPSSRRWPSCTAAAWRCPAPWGPARR